MKNKRIKRIVLIALLTCLCAFVACKQNPEKELIINKNNQNYDDYGTDNNITNKKLNWTEKIILDNKINLNIDAEVMLPKVAQFPIFTVKIIGFTQDEINKYVEILFGDAQLYDAKVIRDKSIIEKEIIEAKKNIEDLRNGNVTLENGIEELEAYINRLEKEYAYAQDAVSDLPIDATMIYDEGYNAMWLWAKADLEKNTMASIDVRTVDNPSESMIKFVNTDSGYSYDDAYEPQNAPKLLNVGLPEEDAVAYARDALLQMNIEGYDISAIKIGINDLKQCYCIYFTKSYYGIQSTFENIEVAGGENSEYALYDRIRIDVDIDGIAGFFWNGREEIVEKQLENVMILEFEKIKEIFKQNIKRKYLTFAENEDVLNINIDRIVLGYMRIRKQDDFNSYNIVPVWDFFGNSEIINQLGSDTYNSVLTINAIDGSIINRSLGY